ncbi:MAG: hypothetical protein GY861_13905 [bacterium]|nr:hypothetical protein [bacterium]
MIKSCDNCNNNSYKLCKMPQPPDERAGEWDNKTCSCSLWEDKKKELRKSLKKELSDFCLEHDLPYSDGSIIYFRKRIKESLDKADQHFNPMVKDQIYKQFSWILDAK